MSKMLNRDALITRLCKAVKVEKDYKLEFVVSLLHVMSDEQLHAIAKLFLHDSHEQLTDEELVEAVSALDRVSTIAWNMEEMGCDDRIETLIERRTNG